MPALKNPVDKYDYYAKAKKKLSENGFRVNPFREIQFGLQFMVFLEGVDGLVRLYEGKKGLRLDLSQVEDEELSEKLKNLLETYQTAPPKLIPFPSMTGSHTQDDTDLEGLESLIGIDESGKGDYFGPLVVAAVCVDTSQRKSLRNLGVADSKTLSDAYIGEIAPEIKKICAHSLVIIANQSYNEIYEKMSNLNHILAWGHARVLENVLNQVECGHALSDQFGQTHLVQNALLKKGKTITLYQKPHAESHLSVAAASVLARDAFVNAIIKLENAFGMSFPKGCSVETLRAAKLFVERYGKKSLQDVSKLHFKLTEQIDTNR